MKRLLSLITVLTLAAAPLATRIEAAPANGAGLSAPVAGSNATGSFTGTFRITRFVNSANGIVAQGVLTGIGTRTADGAVQSVVRTISVPVTIGQGAQAAVAAVPGPITVQAVCDILHLDLGPLSIDLLGLHIDLSRVVLDITAEPGQGNLLGNLLCSVANLLNGGNTNAIVNVLNQILNVLSGAVAA